MGRRAKFFLIAFICSVLAAIGLSGIYQIGKAHSTLTAEKQKLQRTQAFELSFRNFTVAPRNDLRFITGPPQYKSVVQFDGKIFAATSTGLLVYAEDGSLVHHWSTADGLPSNDLTAVAVNGTSLWIGSADAGLIQYRANSWKHFLPKQPPVASVQSLLVTEQGRLIVGTKAGLLLYSSEKWEKFLPEIKSHITALASDANTVFIGTFNEGFYVYRGGQIHHFDTTSGLSDDFVTDLKVQAGNCLVSTPAGIQKLNAGRLQTLASNLFVTSFELRGNALWAAAFGRGVISLNPSSPDTRIHRMMGAFQNSNPFNEGSPPLLRTFGKDLLAFSGDGIFYLNAAGQWKTWQRSFHLLADSNVSALYRSQYDEIWTGYFDSGLQVFGPDWQQKQRKQDDTFFCVNHIAADERGNTYVSTSNGLAVIASDRSVSVYRIADGLLSDRVMHTIPLDPDGKQLAIATSQGFTLKQDRFFKSLFAFHGLANNQALTVAALAPEQLYVGTLGGLSAIHNMQVAGNWTHRDSGLRHNWVNALAFVENRLFVGTYGGGVQSRTLSGDWINYPSLPEKLEINPNALYYDGRFLFAGTLDRGFYYLDPGNDVWKQYRGPLPSRNVTAFASEADYLYVGTTHGILQISYGLFSKAASL